MIDRDNAVQSSKTTRTALAAVLVTAPAGLPRADPPAPPGAARESMRRADLPTALTGRPGCCTRPSPGSASGSPPSPKWQPTSRHRSARSSKRWSRPGRRRVRTRVSQRRADPAVVVPRRADPHEQAFAMLSGTAPVPVSSGRTDRHRLSRLGDRQLNRAIHTIAVTRMRCHQPPRPTLSAAAPKAKPTAKSAAASSATSPAISTGPSQTATSAALDKHRSVISPRGRGRPPGRRRPHRRAARPGHESRSRS